MKVSLSKCCMCRKNNLIIHSYDFQLTELIGVDTKFDQIVGYKGSTWKVKSDAYALYLPGYFQIELWGNVLSELNTYWSANYQGRTFT